VGSLDVLHQTDDYAVIVKPPGLPSVPMRGAESDPARADSVVARAVARFPSAEGPIAIHRLDMETSGLLVIALTRQAHRALSRQFMHREVGKTYAAILQGRPPAAEGSIDLPLVVDWPRRPRQKVDFRGGRVARTLFRVVERLDLGGRPVTRVAFRPVTGRSHQLRVHAATPRCRVDHLVPAEDVGPGEYRCGWPVRGGLGAPILGDPLYGDATTADRLLLHADSLSFWEPGTGAWRTFRSDPAF